MAYHTSKTLKGRINKRTGKQQKDRVVWLAKWLEGGREREKSFLTEREAMLFAAEKNSADTTRSRRLKPAEVRALRRTFDEVADDYLDSLSKPTAAREALRDFTIRSHKGRLAHARAAFGGKLVHTISDDDVGRLRDYLMTRPIKRKTQRECLRVARDVLAYAFSLRLIERVPGEKVTIARTDKERLAERAHHDEVPFTTGEVYTLLRAADDLVKHPPKGSRTITWVRGRALVYLLAHTGLRISEARALRRSDLVLDGPKLTVTVAQSADLAGKIQDVKTLHGRRTVPLHPDAAEPIRAVLGAHNYDLAFASEEGSAMLDRNLRSRYLAPLLARANALASDMAKTDFRLVPVRELAWHSFRHAYAARLIAADGNMKRLQVYLGHHDPAFTLARYGHLVDDDQGFMARMSV